ncbi:MAG: DUF5318 family protein [Microthrixaceae bacterium]
MPAVWRTLRPRRRIPLPLWAVPFLQPDAPGREGAAPGSIDYRLARRQLLRRVRSGEVSRGDVCDAQRELIRVAHNHSRRATAPCPVCAESSLRLVSYVFAACPPVGAWWRPRPTTNASPTRRYEGKKPNAAPTPSRCASMPVEPPAGGRPVGRSRRSLNRSAAHPAGGAFSRGRRSSRIGVPAGALIAARPRRPAPTIPKLPAVASESSDNRPTRPARGFLWRARRVFFAAAVVAVVAAGGAWMVLNTIELPAEVEPIETTFVCDINVAPGSAASTTLSPR